MPPPPPESSARLRLIPAGMPDPAPPADGDESDGIDPSDGWTSGEAAPGPVPRLEEETVVLLALLCGRGPGDEEGGPPSGAAPRDPASLPLLPRAGPSPAAAAIPPTSAPSLQTRGLLALGSTILASVAIPFLAAALPAQLTARLGRATGSDRSIS